MIFFIFIEVTKADKLNFGSQRVNYYNPSPGKEFETMIMTDMCILFKLKKNQNAIDFAMKVVFITPLKDIDTKIIVKSKL